MGKIKLYLDSSCLNRIFDNQSQPRIYLESSAMNIIFNLIDDKSVDVVSSEVLEYESSRNPFSDRKIFVDAVLNKAKLYQKLNNNILLLAKEIELTGVKGIDALHLASAQLLKADYFITCDDEIIKKYRGPLNVRNPIELYIEIKKEI